MPRALLGLGLAALCGCASHAIGGCPPSDVTIEGGTSGLDEGDGGSLEQACQQVCFDTDCRILNQTQLRCQPDCL